MVALMHPQFGKHLVTHRAREPARDSYPRHIVVVPSLPSALFDPTLDLSQLSLGVAGVELLSR